MRSSLSFLFLFSFTTNTDHDGLYLGHETAKERRRSGGEEAGTRNERGDTAAPGEIAPFTSIKVLVPLVQ